MASNNISTDAHPYVVDVTPESPLFTDFDQLSLDSDLPEIKVEYSEVIKGSPDSFGVYPNYHYGRQALILNYENFTNAEQRRGTETDAIRLNELLSQLGYFVTTYSNLTFLETINALRDFSQKEDHASSDSTVVAVMSHGKNPESVRDGGALIYTSNGRCISSEDIIGYFTNQSCPNLMGKPKIFLFQFCRGDNVDYGIRTRRVSQIVTDGTTSSAKELAVERTYEDMLIAYSTIPGHVSYRHETEGTWFIKALCLVLMREACKYHVEKLLKLVDQLIRNWTNTSGSQSGKQTIEIANRGFYKKFFFNPQPNNAETL